MTTSIRSIFRGQNESVPLTKISRNNPSAIATPRARPAAVSQTSGSPLRERPVVAKVEVFGSGEDMTDQTILLRSRSRWRRISAMVFMTKVMAKSTTAPRNRVR